MAINLLKPVNYKNSKIARKISKKLFAIYIVIYCLILCLLLWILTPILYNMAVNKAAASISVITDEFRLLQESIADSLNVFHLKTDLEKVVEEYNRNPSQINQARVDLCLNKIEQTNDKLFVVCLEDSNGNFFSSLSHSYVDRKLLLHENSKYLDLLKYNYSSYLSPVITNQFRSEYIQYKCFAYSKNIKIGAYSYVATAFYNSTAVLEHCMTLAEENFVSLAIVDRYQDFLFNTDNSELYEEINSGILGISGNRNITGGKLFYEVIPSTNCTLIAYTPYYQLLSNAIFIIGAVTLLYLLSPFLYVLFLIPTTQQQMEPLKELSDLMANYTAGDKIAANINTGDEIELLSSSFNHMISEINRHIMEIQKREHENAVVSYKLLATQIDPHFIYNTMNIINIMAQNGDHEAVIEINTALIKILRERLNTKISIFETIKNEIDTMLHYCLITAYRYRNHVSVRFDIDEAIQEQLIPKNILQPLVENAFHHGFPNERDIANGHVDVMIYSIDDEIIIEVSDNGQGMTDEHIGKILNNSYTIYTDKKPHIGINNIMQRLRYLYGDNHKFHIQSALGQGTTIIITVPENHEHSKTILP